jgi:hypothetical protein
MRFEGHTVIIQTTPGEVEKGEKGGIISKAVLVLTREQFIAALKAGKRWKRRQARQRRECR